MAIKYIFTLVLLISFSSCFILKDDNLTLDRNFYTGNDIRLDGYWWMNFESIEPSMSIYFFYENGIALYGRALKNRDLEVKEKEFSTESFKKLINKAKPGWGVFEINSNKITFETWVPGNGGPLTTVIRSGEIINHQTFVITSHMHKGKKSIENDTFYFKKFDLKPDSTNSFIK